MRISRQTGAVAGLPTSSGVRKDYLSDVSSVRPSVRSWYSTDLLIAAVSVAAIGIHLLLAYGLADSGRVLGVARSDVPLLAALALGGVPLVFGLVGRLIRMEFSSDLLAGISIVTAVLLGEYLAGTLVVLMFSGGQALEAYAVRSASSVLNALARRMPSLAHRRRDGVLQDVPWKQ